MMRARNIAAHGVLTVAALAVVLPLVLMFVTSFKPLAEINSGTLFDLPREPTWAAWTKAWGAACIGNRCSGIAAGIWNSVLIVVPALIASMTLGGLTGYALSLCTSRYANALFVVLLASLFIPGQVTLFPMIVWLRELGLFGTRTGVVLVHTVWGLPFVTLLFRSFFLSVPRQILSAARIDRVGFFRMLWHVMLPMSLPVCGVSGGQQQRVAIGRALARSPAALLFDEPLSNLDAKLRAELRAELRRLHEDNRRTTLYVTHDQLEAMTLATRIAVLNDGRIQQCDRPSVVYNQPANLFVAAFIGAPAMTFVAGQLRSAKGTLAVSTAAGQQLPLPGLICSPHLVDGPDLVCGFRPEHIELVGNDADAAAGQSHARATHTRARERGGTAGNATARASQGWRRQTDDAPTHRHPVRS